MPTNHPYDGPKQGRCACGKSWKSIIHKIRKPRLYPEGEVITVEGKPAYIVQRNGEWRRVVA